MIIIITIKMKAQSLPDPRGKKSFPTTLSSTEDFPELYNIWIKSAKNTNE